MPRLQLLTRLSERIGRLITHNQSRWDRSNHRFERINNAAREIDFNPALPGGVAHKLSQNAYWQRDDRRTIVPDYVANQQKLLAAAETQPADANTLPPRPGKMLKSKDVTNEYFPDNPAKINDRLETYGVTWP